MTEVFKLNAPCIAMLTLLMLPFSVAFADESDVFNIVAGADFRYDNNLFRVPSDFDISRVDGQSERGDVVTKRFVGFRIDKPYALQRFKFEFTRNEHRYKNYDFLDFDANEYKAAWLYALTPNLRGVLSANRTQALNNFQDFRGFNELNVRTTEQRRFDVDWSPHGVWHLLAGVSSYEVSNSQEFQAQADYTEKALEGGLQYDFSSGSQFKVLFKEKQGSFDDRSITDAVGFFDTGFDEREVDASLNWVLSGKSKVAIEAGYVKRVSDDFSLRDYDAPIGRVDYTWSPTGKLQLKASLSRAASNFQTNISSYALRDEIALKPTWLISSKMTLEGNVSVANRKFLGRGASTLFDRRKDIEKSASLVWAWKPRRSVTIRANVQRSLRNSSSLGLDFKDTSVGLSAQLFF